MTVEGTLVLVLLVLLVLLPTSQSSRGRRTTGGYRGGSGPRTNPPRLLSKAPNGAYDEEKYGPL